MEAKLQNILSLVDEYITEKHSKKTWEAGKDWVQYAGPYFTSDEYVRSIESLLNEWLVLGNDAQKFEREFEKSTNKIQGALIDVLSMIANKNKLDIVMAKNQLLLVGKDIDLTEDAIKELNKILPKITKD